MEMAWLAVLVELDAPLCVELIRYGISSDTYLVQEWRVSGDIQQLQCDHSVLPSQEESCHHH